MEEVSHVLPQPEYLLEKGVVQHGRYRPKTEVLVKWREAPIEDAAWEAARRMQRSYPEFILADKDD